MKPVPCPHCAAALPLAGAVAGAQVAACPRCRGVVEVEVFPALSGRGGWVGRAGRSTEADEPRCFFHDEKRAEAVCQLCGRYLCATCEIRMGERLLCPECFETGRLRRALPQLERWRLLPVNLALWVALLSLGLLPLPVGLIGGPAAVILAVFGLFRPGSVTGRRAVGGAVAAIVLGLTIAVFWGVVLGGLWLGATGGAK